MCQKTDAKGKFKISLPIGVVFSMSSRTKEYEYKDMDMTISLGDINEKLEIRLKKN